MFFLLRQTVVFKLIALQPTKILYVSKWNYYKHSTSYYKYTFIVRITDGTIPTLQTCSESFGNNSRISPPRIRVKKLLRSANIIKSTVENRLLYKFMICVHNSLFASRSKCVIIFILVRVLSNKIHHFIVANANRNATEIIDLRNSILCSKL